MNLIYSTIKYFWKNLRIWLVQNKAYIEASVWWNSFFNEMTSFCCCSCFHVFMVCFHICMYNICPTHFGVTFCKDEGTFTPEHLLSNGHRKSCFLFLISWKEISYIQQYVHFLIWTDNRPGNEWNTCSCLWARVLHSTTQQTCTFVPTWGRMGLPLDWQAFYHSFL